jgi:hypothetical protein
MSDSSTAWFGVWPRVLRDAPEFACWPGQGPRWSPWRVAGTSASWRGTGQQDRAIPAVPIVSVWVLTPHWSASGTATATTVA